MEIKIGKSARVCAACETEFAHGQQLASRVRQTEEGLVREDFCQACWTDEKAQQAYSSWFPVYHDPAVVNAEPPEAHSPLRQAFYESVESAERVDLAKAYLAAQLLRRQKVFRLIKESDEADGETKIALYTDKHEDRLIEVHDPNLSFDELEEGRNALLQRLAELEAPEDEPACSGEDGDGASNGAHDAVDLSDGEVTQGGENPETGDGEQNHAREAV